MTNRANGRSREEVFLKRAWFIHQHAKEGEVFDARTMAGKLKAAGLLSTSTNWRDINWRLYRNAVSMIRTKNATRDQLLRLRGGKASR